MRELGDLGNYRQHPSHQKLKELRQTARTMVEAEFQRMLSPLSRKNRRKSGHSILVLEFVKEIDDAYAIMDLLRTNDKIRLLQVLYISNPFVGHNLLRSSIRRKPAAAAAAVALCPALSPSSRRTERDKARAVAEGQAKWNGNAGALIEFFSSLGVMSEVSDGNDSILAQLGYSAASDQQNCASHLSDAQWACSLILRRCSGWCRLDS